MSRTSRFGPHLAAVDDRIVELLRSRVDANGLIRVGEPVGVGERVTIEHGPFAALAGIVERVRPEKERVLVLLTSVQAAIRIEVLAASVRKKARQAAAETAADVRSAVRLTVAS